MRKTFIAIITLLMYVSITNQQALAEENRLSGADRYETAVSISKSGWDKSDTVVLATGSNFPDALAGGPLAYQHNAPILLAKKDYLGKATYDEIKRLKATKVIILGGQDVISTKVVDELKNLGILVRRIAGRDRYETAALIATELDHKEEAILAYSKNFPDALAIAPYAARNSIPILLTDTHQLHEATKSALTGITSTIIVGGEKTISTSIENQVPNAVRISGKDRYATAASIIKNQHPHVQSIYLSTGQAFPDSLAGAVLAAKNNSAILLTQTINVPSSVKEFLDMNTFQKITTLGGKQAVSEDSQEKIETINRMGSTGITPNQWVPYEKTHYDKNTNSAIKDELWAYHKESQASKRLLIGKEDSGIGQKQVIGDTIYFSYYEKTADGSTEVGVKSIRVDGKGEQIVLPKKNNFYVIKNRIYAVTSTIQYGQITEKIISEYTLKGEYLRDVYKIEDPYFSEMIVRNGFFFISEPMGDMQEIKKIDPLNGEVTRVHVHKLDTNQAHSLFDVNSKGQVLFTTYSEKGTILMHSGESKSLRLDGEWVFDAQFLDNEKVITISRNDNYDPDKFIISTAKKDGTGRKQLATITTKNNASFEVIDISEHHIVYQHATGELQRKEF